MKKYLGLAVVAAAVAVPSTAAADPGNGASAANSCFGQDRAAYERANGGAGAIISQRKGENAQINADYKATCAAAAG